jgi:hypothetical protein
MAKRAPILPDNYNPVGERLRRVLEPVPETSTQIEPRSSEKIIEIPRTTDVVTQPTQKALEPLKASVIEREPIPDIPTDRELKDVSVRFRCTPSERKKWHEITREIAGDHNQLSHFVRACLLLLENSQGQLERVAPDIQRLRKPASTDSLGLALYEQQLSQFLFDAIKSAGRPRG